MSVRLLFNTRLTFRRLKLGEPKIYKSKLIWLVAGVVGFCSSPGFNHHVCTRSVSIISQSARPRRPIPVKDLAEHCAHFHDNNNALFNDEFKCLDRPHVEIYVGSESGLA
ncbi:hypothetical protein OS493_021497 [Desmophyllum pertusum]|uniref:Uncharacterized protein n=1 Tax=Desmophyllum pertusum TaxID=174260 RepID=A0A9W9YMG2_9CNID|nr:hypothetical protein OS493_021497 [Desmophyllum pertusum]